MRLRKSRKKELKKSRKEARRKRENVIAFTRGSREVVSLRKETEEECTHELVNDQVSDKGWAKE